MNFIFSSLKNIGTDRQSFKTQINIIIQLGQKIFEFSPIVLSRCRFVFKEYFLQVLCKEIKMSINFERKEELIKIIYYFCNQDG